MPAATTIMLAVHCKRTDSVDLKAPILSYIRSTYSDSEAEEAEDDLAGVQSLRAELVTAQGSAQGAQRETLIKYYKALTLIETRFPISSEKGHVKISFPWCDAFRPTKKSSQANIHFEKAAILFNAGAVLSQQALQVERGTTEGITQACKLFQEAAGVFSHLRESEAPKVDVPRPVDLTPEACGLMEKLMLAQAQECVYHKAVADGKSPAVVARLAKQGGLMYGEVAGLFNGVALSSHFEKSWVAHTQMKASLMEVLALVESGKQLQAETKIAKEVATLSEAFTRLQATKKLAAAVSQELADSLRPLEEGLALALTKAQKDNNAIYLEKVPPFCDLPPITGACLVKASPPANLDASSENLFSGLVPESSTKALSKYTDLVDAAVREGLDKLAGATDAARLALRQAELPELLEALDGASPAASLPDALARELGDAAAIGGAAHLRGILAEIGDLRRSVESDLAACATALDEESAADGAARNEHGDRWSAPLSATLAKGLWEKVSSYRSTLVQAGESDGKVIQRLTDSEAAFAALTPEAAAAKMPRLQAPLMPLGPEDPAMVAARLRRGLEALDTLSSERAGIEEALKELKLKDNILPKLMASPSSAYDALFEREIAKYAPLRDDAARSASRNDEAVAALTRDAQAFRAVFEVTAWRAACEAAAGGVRVTLKEYREVLDHLTEGLRFYMSLQEAVKGHQQQCADFAYTRALQRDELKQELARAARQEREAKAAAAMAYLSVNPPQQPQQPAYPAHPPPPPGAYGHPQQQQQQQHYQQPAQQQYPPQGYGAPPQQQPQQAYAGAPQQQPQQHQQQYPPQGYAAPPQQQAQQPYHGAYAAQAPPQPAAYGAQAPPYHGQAASGGGYAPQQQQQQQQHYQQPPQQPQQQQHNPYGHYQQQMPPPPPQQQQWTPYPPQQPQYSYPAAAQPPPQQHQTYGYGHPPQ